MAVLALACMRRRHLPQRHTLRNLSLSVTRVTTVRTGICFPLSSPHSAQCCCDSPGYLSGSLSHLTWTLSIATSYSVTYPAPHACNSPYWLTIITLVLTRLDPVIELVNWRKCLADLDDGRFAIDWSGHCRINHFEPPNSSPSSPL